MTIGIDASRAEAKIKTGVERYSYELLRVMRLSRPKDARVVLYSRAPLPPELGPYDDHWRNIVLRWPPKYFWTRGRLSWEMLRRPPDVLFVPAYRLPYILPERTVVTVHDASFIEHPELYARSERAHQRRALASSCRRADAIIVPSLYTAEQLAPFREEKITIIPLGARIEVPDDGGGIAERPYFLVLGRVEKKKNLGVVIDAFEKFREKHPDFRLLFIGRFANGADKVAARVRRSSAAAGIEMLGALEDEKMYPAMQKAAALLHPCPCEGFGIPAIEAMTLGVPAVVADEGAIAEAAERAGILVPPYDAAKWAQAMEDILKPEVREKAIELGKIRAAAYDWERAAADTWRVLTGN